MLDFWAPLRGHVLERGGRDDREANEEDVRLRIGQWPQPVVILLAGCVPQAQRHRHPIAHHWGRVVVEHCGDIFAREAICRVGYEHARLADGSISDNDTLYWPSRRHLHCRCLDLFVLQVFHCHPNSEARSNSYTKTSGKTNKKRFCLPMFLEIHISHNIIRSDLILLL